MRAILYSVRLVTVAVALGDLALSSPLGCSKVLAPVTPISGGSVSSGGTPCMGGLPATGASVATGGGDPGLVPLTCPSIRTFKATKYPLGARLAPRPAKALGVPVVCELSTRLWLSNSPHTLTQVRGSCVGYGTDEALSTVPGTRRTSTADGDQLYHLATTLDNFAGTWPPTDTGSDTESGWRAAVKLGFVIDYAMADSFESMLCELQKGAGTFGTPWSSSMFVVKADGSIDYDRSNIEGGHNWALVGVDFVRKRVRGRNTWGDGWGCLASGVPGYFEVSFDTARELFSDGAVAGFPIYR